MTENSNEVYPEVLTSFKEDFHRDAPLNPLKGELTDGRKLEEEN